MTTDTSSSQELNARTTDAGAETTDPSDLRFKFGENWSEFYKREFSQERVNVAQEKLLYSLRLSDLSERTFLDIGCGSGIHSLAALRSGAKRIFSFDYDPDSVATTQKLWEAEGKPENWTVTRGDALNLDFVKSLGTFDIVYSWGVLHHTGKMNEAIGNASRAIAPGGIFMLALYSHTAYRGIPPEKQPEDWLRIKRSYVQAGALKRKLLEWDYVRYMNFTSLASFNLRRPKHSLRMLRDDWKRFNHMRKDYIQKRGMSFYRDVKDWLGGYPMEFVNEWDLITLGRDEFGIEILDMKGGEGNTEFLFSRMERDSYFEQTIGKRVLLEGPFEQDMEFGWSTKLPEGFEDGQALLWEDNMPLLSDSNRWVIAKLGAGVYCVEDGRIYFSCRDNANPNETGRTYELIQRKSEDTPEHG